MPTDLLKTLPALIFASIDEAPTKSGEDFGWCIIAPGGDHQWAVAHWNGEGWFATDGLPREPLIWALLPNLDGEGRALIMTAISISQLLTLASAYSEATGLALTGVGQRACGNNKVFLRLAEGCGANVLTMARAAKWFTANWPVDVDWPKGIPGKPRSMVAARPLGKRQRGPANAEA